MSSTLETRQLELIRDGEWDWLILLDGARADVFEEIKTGILEFARDSGHDVDGQYRAVDNSGIGFTKTWFAMMLTGQYDACFNPQPIHTFQGGDDAYDERDHFAVVPGMSEYEWDEELATVPPGAVVDVVRQYLIENPIGERLEALGYLEDVDEPVAIDQGVIRFLQPHPPLRRLVELTKGRANRIRKVAEAVRSGEIDTDILRNAYENNLDWVIEEGVIDLLDVLEGRVVITADHGECLGDCGQYFHSGNHDMHSHLRTVPWLVLDL